MSDDPRFTGYWAAIRADLSKQTVDAVIRLADNEQAAWRKRAEDAEANFARLAGATDDELSRRLEWAVAGNGRTNLYKIRAEGLDIITITPEDES